MSKLRIGKPRRHHPHLNGSSNFLRPGPRLLVSHQRHRRSFSTPMATLAFILQDRNHTLIKGRRKILFSMPVGGARRLPPHSRCQKRDGHEEHPEFHHERRNSSVNAHACRAECGSYAARSSQKNPWSGRENSTFT